MVVIFIRNMNTDVNGYANLAKPNRTKRRFTPTYDALYDDS